ncbi:MAG: PAS domain S-box protein [Oscillatoria sp. PMC 1051.18]|nr:PAS domain S-box protein [Oscillatoria sp. PMC 1050.18]MEC5028916.1 PAS domain S-box protein [Oscillatoria sp. PMC 1051.18]
MYQQAEVDVNRSQNLAHLQRLADNVLGILYQFQIDTNGLMSFPYVSAGCQEILGLDPKLVEEDASLMVDLIIPEDREKFSESVAYSAETLEPWYWEGKVKLHSGVVKWIKAMSRPERQPTGEIIWDGWILDITAQKRSEAALQASNQRIATILSGATEGFFALSDRWCFTYVNSQAEYLLGKSSCELIGRNIWELYPETVESKFYQQYHYAVANQVNVTFEEFYQPLNSWFQVRAYPNGEELSVYVTNINARKQLEISLEELNKLNEKLEAKVAERTTELSQKTSELEALWSAFPDLVFCLAADSEILSYQAGKEQTKLYLPPAEFVGKKMVEILPAEVGEKIRQAMEMTLLCQSLVRIEYCLEMETGKEYYEGRLLPFAENQIMLIVRNISDRKEAENKLKESEKRYQILTEALPICVFYTDAQGNCLYTNDRWQKIAGLTQEEALGKGWNSAIHPEDRERVSSEWYRAASQKKLFNSEYRFQNPEGKVSWVIGNAVGIDNEKGETIGYVGTVTDISDRQEAEMKLQESEKRYQTLTEASPIGVFYTDAQGNCLYINNRWLEISGWSQQEALGDGWSRAIHPEDRERVYKQWYQTALEKKSFHCECRFQQPNGKVTWAIVQALPVIDDEGKTTGYVGTITDISDRQLMETALRRSEERFRCLIQATSQIIWNTDPDGQINSEQASLCAFTGQTYDQVAGWSWLSIVHPEDRERTAAEWEKAIANKSLYQIEHRLRRYDSQYRYMSGRAVPVLNEDGSIREWIGSHTDISDRQAAEAALQKITHDLQEAQKLAHIGNWDFNVTSGEISWSEEVFQIYGFDRQTQTPTLSEHLQQYHPEDREIFQGILAEAIADGKPYDLELRIFHPNGSLRYIHVKGEPVRNEKGEVARLFGTVMDITDRKLVEIQVQEKARDLEETLRELRATQAQLIQTEKMSSLGQLVAGVAHEINNPVNFIYGNLAHATEYCQDLLSVIELYRQHYPHPVLEIQNKLEAVDFEFLLTDLPQLLNSMEVGARRIKEIVASLRNFSRLNEAEFKTVNIHEGIDSTLMILQNRIKAKPDRPQIELVKNYGNLPLVECYPGQLNQVLMNILVNALDVLDDRDRSRTYQEIEQNPSSIWITTTLIEPKTARISIKDNGFGIPENVKNRIFDPFFTTKSVGKGTGLGMSISYQIITEKHQGRIECISELGHGAEFIIEIPLRQKA